jgi:hypothetical protein
MRRVSTSLRHLSPLILFRYPSLSLPFPITPLPHTHISTLELPNLCTTSFYRITFWIPFHYEEQVQNPTLSSPAWWIRPQELLDSSISSTWEEGPRGDHKLHTYITEKCSKMHEGWVGQSAREEAVFKSFLVPVPIPLTWFEGQGRDILSQSNPKYE